MSDEKTISGRRQELFGDPWWRGREAPPAPDPRMFGSATDHCEICPFAAADLCHKPCMQARKELGDGIDVHVGEAPGG